MNLLSNLANLLDKLAADLEQAPAVPAAPAAAPAAPTTDPTQALAAAYQALTGQPATPEILQALMSNPQLAEGLLRSMDKLNAPDSLGEPSEHADQPAEPKTKEEKTKAAEERFLRWLTD